MKALKFIIEANKQQICRLLGWSLLQYAEYVEQKGIQYLQEILFADEHAIRELTKGGMFWSWWKNHWFRRDETFLVNPKVTPGAAAFNELIYEELNSIETGRYPHKQILEESYCLLMDRINVEAVKQQRELVNV